MGNKKKIIKRITKNCSICGKDIKLTIYKNRTYRGGHYFNKITMPDKRKIEYWECPKCYWKK